MRKYNVIILEDDYMVASINRQFILSCREKQFPINTFL